MMSFPVWTRLKTHFLGACPKDIQKAENEHHIHSAYLLYLYQHWTNYLLCIYLPFLDLPLNLSYYFFLLLLPLFSSSFPLHLFSYTLSYFLTHPQGMRKSLLWGRGLLDYRGPVFVLPPLVENDIRHNIQKHTMPQINKA